MDAGTIVALVLGAGGLIWAAVTYFLNRRDAKIRDRRDRGAERERRWLQEKRLIYAQAQGAMSELLRAVAQVAPVNLAGLSPADALLRQAAFKVANDNLREVAAEVDLLAPEVVRAAIQRASSSIWTVHSTFERRAGRVLEFQEDTDAFEEAQVECHFALEAMRADLGVDPIEVADGAEPGTGSTGAD